MLVPLLFAGFRANSVGTDTSLYGMPIYNEAKAFQYTDYKTINPSFAILYQILSWGTARISANIYVFLFLMQLFCTVPALLACECYLKKESWIGVFIYTSVFFPISLNLIRQSIAISWVLWAIMFAYKKQWGRYIIAVAISVLFHTSAIISILIPFFATLFDGKHKKINYKIIASIYIFLILGFISYPILVKVLSKHIVYLARYGSSSITYGGSAVVCFLAFSFIALSMLGLYVYFDFNNNIIIYLANYIEIGAIAYCYSMLSANLYRESLYFLIAIVYLLPLMISEFRALKQSFNSEIVNHISDESAAKYGLVSKAIYYSFILLVLLWCISFGYIYFEILQQHQVVPYLLNI